MNKIFSHLLLVNSIFPKFFFSPFPCIFLFAITLTSCNDSNSAFIEEVEKLEEVISKSEMSLHSVDTSKIGYLYRTSNENLKFLHQNISDTVSKETAILISDYSASRKSLKMFLENYADVLKELTYSKTQLFAMKTDLKNDKMAEDKFTDYFSSESKSVEKLDDLVNNLVQWYSSALKMYESKSPPIENMIVKMKEGMQTAR